jgi:phosphatidate cytidylyltransferase
MTFQRVVTAAALVPVVVGAVWWGPAWLVALLVAVVTVVALDEFFRLGERAGLRGYHRWATLSALWLVFEQWAAAGVKTQALIGGVSLVRESGHVFLAPEAVLVGFALGAGLLALVGGRPLGEVQASLGVSAAAMLLVALPLSYLVRLHGLERWGRHLLLFLLVVIWVGDTLAYFVGRAVGRLPMAPGISPKKTWEGAAANVLGAALVAVVFSRWMQVELLHLVAAAGLANVAGQIGDLVESACKRGAGVKDSGALLPGHGGILDRIDSLVFAAPVMWCYFEFVVR